jgi:CHAT domain-containing protein
MSNPKSKLFATALSLSLFANSALACEKPVTPLTQGQQAPCTGFLFSPEKEKQLRLLNEDYQLLLEQSQLYLKQKELYKQELEETDKIVEKEKQKAELWRKVAEDTTLKYTQVQEARGTRDWLFLIGGVVLTIGAGYALGQAAK